MMMRVLVLTNMYPTVQQPHFGIFVREQVESLRRAGVDVEVLFVNGRRNKLNYLLGYPRLWYRLLRKRYDLIHAHYVLGGLVARGQLGTRVVLNHHGPEVFQTWEATLSRAITRFFDGVIVVSEEMRRRMPCPEATVIPCGVDMARFQPEPPVEARQRLGLPPDRKIVLWAGEPDRPEKRYELVEAAVGILKQQRDDVDLVALSGRPHHVVPAYMNAADVLLLTSDAEGSPMVIKEAMACNLPVVSTAVGDVADVIGGTAGCFICTQEPAEIAERLQDALAFGGRTEGRRAVQRFDLDAIGLRVRDFYEAALGAGNRAPARLSEADRR